MWSGKRRTGKFNIETLDSEGTDFAPRDKVQCWTPDLEAAKMYAACYKAIAAPSEICLVRLEFPKSLVSEQTMKVLQYPSEEWKRVVYYSRRGYASIEPKGLARQLSQKTTLIVGDIATRTKCDIVQLNSWEQLSEWNVLKLRSGQIATQFVFGHMDANKELANTLNRLESKFTIRNAERPHLRLPPLDIFNDSPAASPLSGVMLTHPPYCLRET
jgi:hypothetical protein